ncbi:hypothetical protein IJS77_04940 [bacterium]|nr:hypothetical protein [bacterium]
MTSIDRNKFTTENGLKLYDLLKSIAPHEDWLFAMLMLAKGDDQRAELINFINSEKRTVKEISYFVIEKLG